MSAKNECARLAAYENNGEGWAAWAMDSLFLKTVGIAADPVPAELSMNDYLNARRKLVYEAMHFPLGYPVRVLSNSPRVLEAAEQSWSCFEPVFQGEPFELLIEVKAGSSAQLPPEPVHMVKGPLLMQVADLNNFYIADMAQGRALGRVTPVTAGCPAYLRYHILEGAALSLIATARAVPVHAACVRACGRGVLFCADSGEGKSTLAYAGARAGWTYVTDDSTYVPLHREDRLAIGNCHRMRFRPSAVDLFPELAGYPLTPRVTGKPSVEVRTSQWPEIRTANATVIDHVVFLNRKNADTQELIPLRPAAVWPWFTQHLMAPPEIRAAQEAALSHLLDAGVFELRYSDLGWAIDRINELAQKGY
jgi:hypothetical protein